MNYGVAGLDGEAVLTHLIFTVGNESELYFEDLKLVPHDRNKETDSISSGRSSAHGHEGCGIFPCRRTATPYK